MSNKLLSHHAALVQDIFLGPLGLALESLSAEAEGNEYAAARGFVNGRFLCFRASKITPTKLGQFVTLWKRPGGGSIVPLVPSDAIDYVLISVLEADRFGIFLFPADVLVKQGIFTSSSYPGKLAMRIYPSWVVLSSKQAIATQRWQSVYFFEQASFNLEQQKRMRLLLGL